MQRSRSLPRRYLVVVLALAALVAAGCSDDGTPTKPAASTAGPTLLSLAVYGPPQVITAYANIAAAYNLENPNTSVSIEPYGDAAEARAAIQQQIAAGTTPDLFLTPVEALPTLEKQKALREVGELLLDRDLDFGDGYQRYALEAFSSDHSLQCMPVDTSPMVVYYNTDLVDLSELNSDLEQEVTQETGWSFAQFEVAARLPHPNGARGLYVEPSLDQLAPFIFSGGGKLLDNDDEPTRLALNDGSTRDALLKVLPLLRDPVVNFTREEIKKTSALQRFKDGDLAMLLGFRSLTPELRTAPDLHFDVMPMPKVGSEATIGESSGLCLSATSTQVEQAADFLAYVVGDDAMSQLAATGFVVPSNNDIAHADTFLQPDAQPAHATVFTDQVRTIKQLPTVVAWPSIVETTTPMITELLYDPLIKSFDERLQAIDEASEPPLEPKPDGSATP